MQIDVQGAEEVAAAIRDARGRLSGAGMQAALMAGALPIMNAAKTNAPALTGTLRRSIHVLSQSAHEVEVGTNLIYAAMQEYGGVVAPVNARFLRFETAGGDIIFTRGPVYIPAQPYMRPAFESERGRAVREVASAIRDLIAAGGPA